MKTRTIQRDKSDIKRDRKQQALYMFANALLHSKPIEPAYNPECYLAGLAQWKRDCGAVAGVLSIISSDFNAKSFADQCGI